MLQFNRFLEKLTTSIRVITDFWCAITFDEQKLPVKQFWPQANEQLKNCKICFISKRLIFICNMF